MYCYCKLLYIQNQLSRLYLLSILEHIQYFIIDEMFGSEVMQSDARYFDNEGICYSSHKIKKTGDIGIKITALVLQGSWYMMVSWCSIILSFVSLR